MKGKKTNRELDALAEQSPESWSRAKSIAGGVGEIPTFLTTTVRILLHEQRKGGELRRAGEYCLKILLASSSIKAPLYFAGWTFKPELTEGRDLRQPRAWTRLFTPEELAYLIALLVLYRRINRMLADSSEFWPAEGEFAALRAEFGGQVGIALPRIGLSWGVTGGAIRHFASSLFYKADKKAYAEYKEHLVQRERYFDIERERELWGCSHLQVASLLLISLGLGRDLSCGLLSGLEKNGPLEGTITRHALEGDNDALRMRVLTLWIDTLQHTGGIPNISHLGEYYPLEHAQQNLLNEIGRLKQRGSRYRWLSRGKLDIDQATHPELFAAEGPRELPSESPPEEVLGEFSPQELEEMKRWDFETK